MDEVSTNLKLMRLLRRLGVVIMNKATPFKGQGRILGLLRNRGCAITQRELLDITEMKSSSLSEIVKKLEENGYINKEVDKSDKRNMILSLTDKGLEESYRMRSISSSIADNAFECLTEEEKESLIPVLEKLKEFWSVSL
ncbi:MAG: winged helix-turn-helix transcriptional regulator [Spirochaetales bacterium]|nr:winged helix-turn-helix transcriptional regulator [Spirochaetales bacterium]